MEKYVFKNILFQKTFTNDRKCTDLCRNVYGGLGGTAFHVFLVFGYNSYQVEHITHGKSIFGSTGYVMLPPGRVFDWHRMFWVHPGVTAIHKIFNTALKRANTAHCCMH